MKILKNKKYKKYRIILIIKFQKLNLKNNN